MSGQTKALPSFPAAQTNGALAAIDAQIASERQTLAEIERAHREHKGALSRLEDARRTLVKTSRVRRRERTKIEKTAEQRAGKGNIEKALDLLRHNGPTAKAQITRLMDKNDGTVTYALRALEERGQARKTGERVGGSDVWEAIPKRRAVTRPGDRR